MLNSIKLGFIVLLTLFTSLNVQAAGDCIRRHARYLSSAAKQTSLAISNSDTQERYLVNSWIENSAGQKEKRLSLRHLYSSANPKAKTRCVLSTPGNRYPGIGSRYSG